MSGARHDVVAAAIKREGDILLCLRSPNRQWYPNVWELPGGHRSPGERQQDALRRELLEELGVTVHLDGEPVLIQSNEVSVALWHVSEWSGDIANAEVAEHTDIRWVSTEAARLLPLGPLARLLLVASTAGPSR